MREARAAPSPALKRRDAVERGDRQEPAPIHEPSAANGTLRSRPRIWVGLGVVPGVNADAPCTCFGSKQLGLGNFCRL